MFNPVSLPYDYNPALARWPMPPAFRPLNVAEIGDRFQYFEATQKNASPVTPFASPSPVLSIPLWMKVTWGIFGLGAVLFMGKALLQGKGRAAYVDHFAPSHTPRTSQTPQPRHTPVNASHPAYFTDAPAKAHASKRAKDEERP
ncbi:MAG: hypothetical protein HEQ32_07905 [Vampirovibrio sp.]